MAVAEVLLSPLPESEHRTQLRRAVIASTIGTTIEWYDFLLYSVVTGLVFGKLFFPHSDPLVGLLQAFAVYTVGFVARPIGAAIFGHYGHRIAFANTVSVHSRSFDSRSPRRRRLALRHWRPSPTAAISTARRSRRVQMPASQLRCPNR
jgi:MFS family permease